MEIDSNGEGGVGVYRASLTSHPNSVTIHEGDPLPAFTYSISGFANSETQASATTGIPTLPTTSVPGRSYAIGSRGTLAAHNYSVVNPGVSSKGILTILR